MAHVLFDIVQQIINNPTYAKDLNPLLPHFLREISLAEHFFPPDKPFVHMSLVFLRDGERALRSRYRSRRVEVRVSHPLLVRSDSELGSKCRPGRPSRKIASMAWELVDVSVRWHSLGSRFSVIPRPPPPSLISFTPKDEPAAGLGLVII
ncbi:uncharacterized protein BT62DRAFT_999372 [Guyanagaster necrorhizus]|uniref:Uncharacterized protein n=1 Tax=Guyanagaster necrorhizus TaxID=856835 RepID=A0A9P8AXE7_9AGAR|nr:uncharacterized protein BT62DRAFT_999372 [Guyanagaster necrorhizus MCA 3950]KAG7451699.1 hypothetical protein BT62DRAFT_999372 [Guyanagaster necrorhizus MCA 3950]